MLFTCAAADALGTEFPLTDRNVIQLADEKLGAKVLAEADAFIEAQSPFDRAARMQTDQSMTREEFQTFVSSQARSWSEEETKKMAEVIASIGKPIAYYASRFPMRILLVKTTGKEEGGAAYCRGLNVIVVPQHKLGGEAESLERILIHELFHIASRNNLTLRDALYEAVGFKPCPGIELPESLMVRKITNPDAPVVEHYIEVSVAGQKLLVVPVLYTSQAAYEVGSGKDFFDYLTFRLLVIERAEDRWRPRYRENEPWLVDVSDVKGFHEQIGRNTGYIIHPEEVLADNFVLLVRRETDVPSPEILERMDALLIEP
jgi:hypothetical protein